jgi:outer membrane protein OmpA-like peptidoglycan-associated protein
MLSVKTVVMRFFFFLLLCCFAMPLCAQLNADDYFRAEQYALAIKGFEKQSAKKNNQNVKGKLAYCYRMTNQQASAFDLYSDLIKMDKVRPEHFYYFAEALTQKEMYDSARVLFSKYLTLDSKDELGAKKMLQNLDVIPLIKPYFPNIKLLPFSQNSDADDNSPAIFKRQVVFSSDRDLGFQMLKQKSGTTGRDFLNIYSADILNDSTFAEIQKFSGQLSQKNANTGASSFTYNNQLVFFEQNSTTLSKKGTFNLQLYSAEAEGSSWKNIEKLPFCVNEIRYMHPAISPDGSELYFVMEKSGAGTDIFYARKDANGHWNTPQHLGDVINTSLSEGFPFVDRVGRLYFASRGHAGYGGFDIFMSEKNDVGEWQKPINLGKPINSSFDDISFLLFMNGVSGAFASNRDGGDDDVYFFNHADSTRLFVFPKEESKQETAIEKLQEEKEEKQPDTKPSFEAPTHIVAPEPIDFCQKYKYCDIDVLEQGLLLIKDTSDIRDSSFLKKNYVLPHIRFDEKNNILKDSLSEASLQKMLDLMNGNTIKVQFFVHSATKGSADTNLENTKKQGLKLIKWLSDKGIARERLKSKGMGETQPICEGRDCDDFSKHENDINQRIEIKVTPF